MNRLGTVVSSNHMKIKNPTDKGTVGVIRVYQIVARKCYEGSLKNKKRCLHVEKRLGNWDEVKLDPRVDYEEERPRPVEKIKTIMLDEGMMLKVGRKMEPELEEEVKGCLKQNMGAFAWFAKDLTGIDPDFMCHHLLVD